MKFECQQCGRVFSDEAVTKATAAEEGVAIISTAGEIAATEEGPALCPHCKMTLVLMVE